MKRKRGKPLRLFTLRCFRVVGTVELILQRPKRHFIMAQRRGGDWYWESDAPFTPWMTGCFVSEGLIALHNTIRGGVRTWLKGMGALDMETAGKMLRGEVPFPPIGVPRNEWLRRRILADARLKEQGVLK